MEFDQELQLIGTFVALDPLHQDHANDLATSAAEDRSTFGFAPVPSSAETAISMVAERLVLKANGSWIPFVQRRLSDNQLVGMTNLLNVERWNGPTNHPTSVEIGGTWLAPSAQRSPINTEAKLLLLTHAFESWNVQRVQIKTDERNTRSRTAIQRLGAQFEGVLRNYQPGQGDLGAGAPRNTAMYSLTPEDWPAAKAHLTSRLSQ